MVYANALPNGFTYDDVPIVLENPAAFPEAPWWAAWTQPYWPGSNRGDNLDVLYRPLTVQTYWLQRRIAGAEPWSYHAVNILLHAAVCATVLWVVRRLGASRGASLFASALFAVHPVHVEAVANVVGRAELISAGAMMLTLVLLDAFLNRRPGSIGHAGRFMLFAGMLLAGAAAMFSKESGAAVVVFAGAWAWYHRAENANDGAPSLPGRRRWKSIAVPVLALAVVFALYLFARYEVCGERLVVEGQRVAVGNPLHDAGWRPRLLTPPALLGKFVGLMLWPDRLLADYSLNVLPPVETWTRDMFWIGLAVVVAAVLALWLARRNPAAWFVAVAFAATFLIPSNSLILTDVIFAERILYSPSIWVCVALGLVASRVLEWLSQRSVKPSGSSETTDVGRRGIVPIAAGLAVVLALSFRTFLRNPVWHDNLTLFAHDLSVMDPGRRSARFCSALGRVLLERGNLEEAESLFREAIGIFPGEARYHRGLGEAYLAMGRVDAAAAALERARMLDPRDRQTLALLDRARWAQQGMDPDAAYATARSAAEANPESVEAVRAWARLAEAVAPGEAVEAYRRLVELAPDDPAHWSGLALALYSAGRWEEAASVYAQLLDRWPEDWNAHSNLALILMDQSAAAVHDPERALFHARRAVRLNPRHWQLRVNLAEVTAHCGDPQEAAAMFEELARQSDAGSPEQRLYRQRAEFLRNK